MTWQEPVVALIVLAAVGYLVWKLFGRRRRSAKKPDVKASDLLKKDR